MPPTDLTERLRAVDWLVLDIDGVLTDGRIIVDDHGVESKDFYVRDGAALHFWLRLGKRAAILSGRSARCVEVRAAELKLSPVVQGSKDKGADLRAMLAAENVDRARVLFVGDDLADLPAFAAAGVSACPADAADEVLGAADYVAKADGGRGVVREVVERILHAQGLWAGVVAGFRNGTDPRP